MSQHEQGCRVLKNLEMLNHRGVLDISSIESFVVSRIFQRESVGAFQTASPYQVVAIEFKIFPTVKLDNS